MTETQWYDGKQAAKLGVALMENSGWEVRQLVIYSTPDGLPRYAVVFEREEGR